MEARATRNLGTRILAVGALVLASTALAWLVTQRPEGATASAGYADELQELAAASEKVTLALQRLDRGRGTKAARKRIRTAMAEVEEVERWLEATPDVTAAERLANALSRHRDYLDAVGSALANPRSPLRHRLKVRGRRVEAAYASLPDAVGLDRSARATPSVRDYVRWRRSRL